MSRITFTEAERELMATLSMRQHQILIKLAGMFGSDRLNGADLRLAFEDFIGKGFDEEDSSRVSRLLKKMTGVLEEVANEGGALFLWFRPEALSLVRKLAMQAGERPANGKGNAYGRAVLALKRAFGVRSDAFYTLEFCTENFNYGEDTGYLDNAFTRGDRWRMYFSDRPLAFLRREVEIRPLAGNRLAITQTVSCEWPGCEDTRTDSLGVIPVAGFIDPEAWETMIPGIVGQGRLALEKAREKMERMLEIRLDDGEVISKADLVRNMKAVCNEEDRLCGIFGTAPEVRQSPEWPLKQEPRAFFREFSCDLAQLENHFLNRLGQNLKWDVECFRARLWLHLFSEKYGIGPDALDVDEYGSVGAAHDLRKAHPEKAGEIGPEYRQALREARIRLAWGLATRNFRQVRSFVNGVLAHPAIGKKEIPFIGWDTSSGIDRESMRKCLDDAERFALWTPESLNCI